MSEKPREVELLISNATVLTMDADRNVFSPGAIAIDGDRIVAVGSDTELRATYAARSVIDASGQIAIPGLIDCHGQSGHALTRGWYEGIPMDGWQSTFANFYRTHATESFWYADGLLAATERALAGVTTSLSYPGSTPCLNELHAVQAGIRAYRQVGLRHVAAVGPGPGPWPHVYGGPHGTAKLSLADELELTRIAVAEFSTDDLMCMVLPAPANLTMDPAGVAGDEVHPDSPIVWEYIARLAKEYEVPIHARAFRGMVTQAVQFVPEIVGPQLLLAHCTTQTRTDRDLIGAHHCSVAHGHYTYENAKSPCHVVEMLDGGANVVLATGGTGPNRSLDLLAHVHAAMQSQRIQEGDVQVLPAAKALAMVTIDAAKALGLGEEIGSLVPGKKADIVIVDGRAPHLQPFLSELALHRLIYAANGGDVSTVIVDGRIVVRDRQLLTVDVVETTARATEESYAAIDRSGLTDPLLMPVDSWTSIRV
ncbi:amidohydrolase family protein [Arthrobacter sp. MI7-26]|uniref:amidohydrolase family protein n=1 Tax=Arthrobacter sp. MI7-26 TaxID=2993653 RepID=UPI002248E77D|nr:amidohydrolase family protein [Arthrobacter sp. MI7-26]MCX2750462.1 amidohydrolase family protein [Arthrobacter sp. MI7-26]